VRRRRLFVPAAWAVLLAPLSAGAGAQTVVTSGHPDRVAVTVYRDPGRYPGDAPSLQWLNGFALISETRRVSVPAGDSTIRFEGVAGGIVPQSAIVTGFPDGIVERNRDAYLLSPETLLDRSLGRRVHIRRTSEATGAVREEEAIIRSGADGAVVLQTARGVEALRCTGLPETLVYDRVPAELAVRPTLSVRTRASRPVTATVTLSYIASGFDWQANYVASLSPDGGHVELFAWLTLASLDETSFVAADTQAVAGRINRTAVRPEPSQGGPLAIRCWPQARTSDIPLEQWQRTPPAPPAPVFGGADAILVTGTRIRRSNLESVVPITTITATYEDLGDLKLYRIPEPVTVAANSQKQVALMTRPNVRMDLVYRDYVQPARRGADAEERPQPAGLYLATRNRTEEGLGLPLPAGSFLLFTERDGRPFMLGEGALGDRAVGDKVEVSFGDTPGVTSFVEKVRETTDWIEYRMTVASDRPAPIRFEAIFFDVSDEFRPNERLPRRDGFPLWAVTVPANGGATISYRILKAEEQRRQERAERERERRDAERDARENADSD